MYQSLFYVDDNSIYPKDKKIQYFDAIKCFLVLKEIMH